MYNLTTKTNSIDIYRKIVNKKTYPDKIVGHSQPDSKTDAVTQQKKSGKLTGQHYKSTR